MIQNIAIIGFDRKISYDVAKILAEELDMFFFDALELFEFDHAPRTLNVVLQEYGFDYYKKKEKSIVGYATEFSNCIINFESGVSENTSNFEKMRESCIIVYIKEELEVVKRKISKNKYRCKEEKMFFNVEQEILKKRDSNLNKNADVIIEVGQSSNLKIASDIIRGIKGCYNDINQKK